MTHLEAKNFTNKVFDLIKKCKTTEDIDDILVNLKIPQKNWMKSDTYPQIKFKLDKSEIDSLINDNLIDKSTLTFKQDITEKLTDPFVSFPQNPSTVKGEQYKYHIYQSNEGVHQ
jgi:hypothetical protein